MAIADGLELYKLGETSKVAWTIKFTCALTGEGQLKDGLKWLTKEAKRKTKAKKAQNGAKSRIQIDKRSPLYHPLAKYYPDDI